MRFMVIEKLLRLLCKTVEFIESLVSQSLGLPANFLKELNGDKILRPWQECISALDIWVSYSTVDSSNYNCQGESKICIWVFRFP